MMVSTLPKPRKRLLQREVLEQTTKERNMPWHAYQSERGWKDLIPGYAGVLDDEQLAFIVEHLKSDNALRLWWGMKGSWQTIPELVVRRLAMQGSDESLAHNRTLARRRK